MNKVSIIAFSLAFFVSSSAFSGENKAKIDELSEVSQPEILQSVSGKDLAVLSKNDSKEIRGEYYSCYYSNYQTNNNPQCHWETSQTRLPNYEYVGHGFTRRWAYIESDYWSYYVTR